MRCLFIHQNFPAQFVHLAPALVSQGHEVVALGTQRPRARMPGVRVLNHRPVPPAPAEEVIEHGHNGLLVDFFDHQALADTVADALERRAELQALRQAARLTVVQRYDLQRVCLPAMLAFAQGSSS